MVVWRMALILTLISTVFSMCVMVFGPQLLPEKYTWDYQLLQDVSNNQSLAGSESGSYFRTALVFDFIGWDTIRTFHFFLVVVFSIVLSINVKNTFGGVLMLFAFIPAVILSFSVPQKETLVLFLSIVTVYLLKKHNWKFSVPLVLTLYVVYGQVREYYLLIGAVFILLLLVRVIYILKGNRWTASVVALGLISLAYFVPGEYFIDFQSIRYFNNLHREIGALGSVTIFLDDTTPTGFISFSVMYIKSIVFFFLPSVKFGLKPEAIYLQAFMILFVVRSAMFFMGDLKKKSNDGIIVLLLFSHIFVLLIFEPDLGSFLRHLSAVSLYFIPLFGEREWRE